MVSFRTGCYRPHIMFMYKILRNNKKTIAYLLKSIDYLHSRTVVRQKKAPPGSGAFEEHNGMEFDRNQTKDRVDSSSVISSGAMTMSVRGSLLNECILSRRRFAVMMPSC